MQKLYVIVKPHPLNKGNMFKTVFVVTEPCGEAVRALSLRKIVVL